MSLEIRSPKAGALAHKLATATREDIETAVLKAIEERLVRIHRRLPVETQVEVDALFDRLTSMPVVDNRTPDAIIGLGPDGPPH